MNLSYCKAAIVTTLFAALTFAQNPNAPISTDGSDPSKWDRKLDGPMAAPNNHKILFEDDEIRVQSVTIPPGTEEPYHLQPYPAVLIIDGLPAKAVDRDGKGNVIKEPVYLAQLKTLPFIGVQPPNALHSVKNNDSVPVHLIRIECKKNTPQLLAYPSMGPASSQGPLPISTNGSDPATWDPQKASAIAAPGNHKIVFENENLRVISVTIPRGTTEPQHDHPFYSLLLIDSDAHDVDHDLSGKVQVTPQQSQARRSIPFAFLQPPQALHAVEDQSTDKDGHLIRIEFKKGFKQL